MEISQFLSETSCHIDTMFLADLDDGIITIHTHHDEDDKIIKLLMEILSEIPFERHWIGQSKLHNPALLGDEQFEHELWLIYRVSDTDFCLMGRAYYHTSNDRDELINRLEILVSRISEIITSQS